ncbi:RNA polymerase sigma factor for flagellar operon [Teredinibacter turnerae T7901]|uniref:RNA polymerase sigma factor FliA n=1 Tax=Teredinibacter turnerae (strain ATCC 39867 / T7901) TaxID=377629 RepID=C5BSH3_TERTT|nr:RNA polymerase sigma factor FliA [Teredinibacter turnerae]ACR14393.1 RNA polymerase sigma factor for flagellar operon [Teredinibacter turnerae T7901]
MVYEQAQEAAVAIRVEDYVPLVKRIAHHMMARMPSHVLVDDLMQAGMIGLLEAAQKYDAGKGASFETYAGIRIRGAIVDEMRRGDWAPRSVHRNARRVSEAIGNVEARLGRDARDGEIAEELQMSLDEYHDILRDSTSTRLYSLEETFEENENQFSLGTEGLDEPAEKVQIDAMRKALAGAIEGLPEREQLVLSLYYEQEMNLKEIGLVLGVSESRISQIHSQAALRLKSKLTGW